jgi:hypothetical protein
MWLPFVLHNLGVWLMTQPVLSHDADLAYRSDETAAKTPQVLADEAAAVPAPAAAAAPDERAVPIKHEKAHVAGGKDRSNHPGDDTALACKIPEQYTGRKHSSDTRMLDTILESYPHLVQAFLEAPTLWHMWYGDKNFRAMGAQGVIAAASALMQVPVGALSAQPEQRGEEG